MNTRYFAVSNDFDRIVSAVLLLDIKDIEIVEALGEITIRKVQPAKPEMPEALPLPRKELPTREEDNGGLTTKEAFIMRAIPEDNFYESGYESTLWTLIFLEDCIYGTIPAKAASGVLSSLVKKGMIYIDNSGDPGRDSHYAQSTLTLKKAGVEWMKEFSGINLDEEGWKIR